MGGRAATDHGRLTTGHGFTWQQQIVVSLGSSRSQFHLAVGNNRSRFRVVSCVVRLQMCRKPSTLHLVNRLKYSNLLGLDVNLKNGSLKEGTLNWEMLQFKSKFPREVLLCRVGDFYEAIGIDACILVEYAGLNPFGGLRPESIPKAGCPVVNLRQTLDDLTRNGYSVWVKCHFRCGYYFGPVSSDDYFRSLCIVEEVQGPTQARSRKSRFISGGIGLAIIRNGLTSEYGLGITSLFFSVDAASKSTAVSLSVISNFILSRLVYDISGSPYVFGLVGIDHDLDFPEPMPVIGVSRSAKGYCIISILETMKTYSLEDGLTEDALVTKLRTSRAFVDAKSCIQLVNIVQLRLQELLAGENMVKELYGLENEVTFRNVTVSYENRPRPLHLGTATQIGAIPTEGIPCLLKVLLPSNCSGLPILYVRDLLLNPPAYEIASTIQAICKLMSKVTCSIPEFTCVAPAKLVKLLELREANHIEFCRIKNVLDEILHMYGNSELNEILELLMDPTWVATGLKIDFETLVEECRLASVRIGEMISLDGESDQKICSYDNIPSEFFEDMESTWKGRVKRIHIEPEIAEVEMAAEALSLAATEDFLPIISRIKATTAPLGGPKGEILYAREHEAVWFKGKKFRPTVWASTPGEEQIKQLKPAVDSKGRKVGEEWFSTLKVEEALERYHEAGAKAKAKVLELLRGLSSELQTKINILVFASMLLVIGKALFAHVSEGRRRKWVFPALKDIELDGANCLKMNGLSPYWFDAAEGSAVHNTVDMQSLFLLTGPNGGESASIPYFDAIMLHMKSYDSPADGKSSFQVRNVEYYNLHIALHLSSQIWWKSVEMSEIRSIVTATTSRSLVLIDEICRGTETAKGTCIAGSIIETLDNIGCLGIVSTHLHGIFSLPLKIKNAAYKAMGTEYLDGQTVPTWKLVDGICRESLAFETAKREGVPETIIQRAEDLYMSVYVKDNSSKRIDANGRFHSAPKTDGSDEAHPNLSKTRVGSVHHEIESKMKMEVSRKEIERAINVICQKKLTELSKQETSELAGVNCVMIAAREQPPPSIIGASCVYVMLRPDKKLYIGQTDDLDGRIRAHRGKEGMQSASFLYFVVPGKSIACQIETLLINQLYSQGFLLANIADGKHRNFGTSSRPVETLTVP
ncbi:DNA mismatch repair protein MSH1 [Citrus sinensis]|nr:DNA mismatch repair protein MSH1 [Citrus sinensis]